MIKVYFEKNGTAEQVATFENEDTYISCLPILTMIAEQSNQTVTEAVEDGIYSKNAIIWTTDDFESTADRMFCELKQDNPEEFKNLDTWEQLYDKSKFTYELEKMINQHDASIGITWLTIEEHVGNCEIKS